MLTAIYSGVTPALVPNQAPPGVLVSAASKRSPLGDVATIEHDDSSGHGDQGVGEGDTARGQVAVMGDGQAVIENAEPGQGRGRNKRARIRHRQPGGNTADEELEDVLNHEGVDHEGDDRSDRIVQNNGEPETEQEKDAGDETAPHHGETDACSEIGLVDRRARSLRRLVANRAVMVMLPLVGR